MRAAGSDKYAGEDWKEWLKEDDEKFDRELVKGMIRSVFQFVIFAGAVVALIGALSNA